MGGTERAEHDLVPEPAETASPEAPTLVVGSAFDPAEREAEQVAEKVLARIASGEDEHVHVGASQAAAVGRREAAGAAAGVGGGALPAALAVEMQDAVGGGEALPAALRRTLEPAMNADLGKVRIHTDTRAASLSQAIGAMAYTQGNDIFFGSGQFQPETEDGLRTIAHEVTHTLQNSGGAVHRRIAGTLDGTERLGGAATVVVKQRAPKKKAAKENDTPVAAGEVVSDEQTSDDIASDEKATDAVLSDEQTSDDIASDEKATDAVVSDEQTSDEVASDERADEKDGAGPAARTKLSAWDRIINGLTVYERHEKLLDGKKVDSHLQLRGTLMADRDRVAHSVELWRDEAKDQQVPDGRAQAIAALSDRLAQEEKLIEDDDQSEWLESFGFGTDDEAYGDDSDDSVLLAALDRGEAEDLSGVVVDDGKLGDVTDTDTEGPALNPSEVKTQDDAAERIDEILTDEVVAPAKSALGNDGVQDSVVGDAVEEVKDTDAATSGPDRDLLRRALTKLQVLDAIVGRADGPVQDSEKDAAHELAPGGPVIDAQLAAAVLRLNADDVMDALDGLLPQRQIEATLERLDAVQTEIKDAAESGDAGPGVVTVGTPPDEAEQQVAYLREIGVSSPDELKKDVDEVVVGVVDGSGGSSLSPALGRVIGDLPEPVLAGVLEAMAMSDGPNALITDYLMEHKVDDDAIQDVVEAAVSAYFDSRLLATFVRWAGETTMPIATLAQQTLNAGYEQRFAADVVGAGLA